MTHNHIARVLAFVLFAAVLPLSGCEWIRVEITPTGSPANPAATAPPMATSPPTATWPPTWTPTPAPTETPSSEPTETPAPTETPIPSEGLLLPDLAAIPPQTAYIQFEGSQKYLRFETSFANVGKGTLHIVGERDPERDVVRAIQTIVTAGGEERAEEIGQFVFHPEHTHWHLEEFARYELWSHPEESKRKLLLSREKVSFCMFDSIPYDLTLPNAPQQKQFEGCDHDVQGVSVGWADVYPADLPDQAFDITGYPDGRYQLAIAVNPTNHIIESNLDNNDATVVLQISASDVQILEE